MICLICVIAQTARLILFQKRSDMVSLQRDGNVFVLDMGDSDNRFNADSLEALEGCLTEVEAGAPCALVTVASGKIWSNGLDLEWMGTQGDAVMPFLARVHELLARVLQIGVPTVAALQGHTFAAGAMLALAHDHRVMRADRGFFCLPEVDLGLSFTPGMSALIAARLPSATTHEAMTTGRRYGGVEAAAAGIVHEAVAEEEVRAVACARAAALAGKQQASLGAIKRRLYESTLAALRGPLEL
jgi:enoyl-CoA hydratase/carnithine racemase